jgi:uncharacterized membrane protein YgcG
VIGTPAALSQSVLNKLLLAVLATVAVGCVDPCNHEIVEHGLAPRPQYDQQIDQCVTQKSCVQLCRSVFGLDGSVEIRTCELTDVDAANGHVTVRFYDANACADDSDSDVYVDDSGDYTSDDGTTDDGSDDGSTTDGSSDGGDDGSTSDGGDSGGDSGGGGDDGGDRHAPKKTDVVTTSQSRT